MTNENIGFRALYAIWIECIQSIHAYAKCASNYVHPFVVDETRYGVRDVDVNVRGSAVTHIEQTIYACKNSCVNISHFDH